MKKLIIASLVALIMLNCKEKDQTTETPKSDTEKVIAEKTNNLNLGCYVFDDGKNKISLEITKNGKEIKGNLDYTWAEKDKNSGTFIGELKDGILIANYTFLSEGKETIRQVAFKIESDKLIEGYGKLNNEGTAFEDIHTIEFTSKMPIAKTDCN